MAKNRKRESMKIGIIGIGVVGSTLKNWLQENTNHEIACLDPIKNHKDDLKNSKAIFVCIPVEPFGDGQDIEVLQQEVKRAKAITQNVFIRSTVLPGTNDRLGTISMPEFLTQRNADQDMNDLPIISGSCDFNLLKEIFPGKQFLIVSNAEAELAKYAHNCFGAMKVTYFNIINKLCDIFNADYEKTVRAASVTGFIEPQHTQVPGPDGQYGYGGKCFPSNMESLYKMLEWSDGCFNESKFFKLIMDLNNIYRNKKTELTFETYKPQTEECSH